MAEQFTEVGLDAPNQVRVMRVDHQIAQKLHAVSGEGSERARDLVDLQLLGNDDDLDLAQVAVTCKRLFEYRRQQVWATRSQLRLTIVSWIEFTYDRRRKQDHLGRLTPIQYETIMETTQALAA